MMQVNLTETKENPCVSARAGALLTRASTQLNLDFMPSSTIIRFVIDDVE